MRESSKISILFYNLRIIHGWYSGWYWRRISIIFTLRDGSRFPIALVTSSSYLSISISLKLLEMEILLARRDIFFA